MYFGSNAHSKREKSAFNGSLNGLPRHFYEPFFLKRQQKTAMPRLQEEEEHQNKTKVEFAREKKERSELHTASVTSAICRSARWVNYLVVITKKINKRFAIFHADRWNNSSQCLLQRLLRPQEAGTPSSTTHSILVIRAVTHTSTSRAQRFLTSVIKWVPVCLAWQDAVLSYPVSFILYRFGANGCSQQL
jgi:hypothetical protein